MYDVVVVGARCAGGPLAMLLARAGHQVALVDRATFPSDTMSTHFLWPRGAARLRAWGLLDTLESRGCAPITQITFDVGAARLHGSGPAVDGVAASYCPRRTVLDEVLVQAAAAAGADLIEGTSVDEVVWDDGRAAGVRVRQRRTGRTRALRARLVVGADGLRSTIADAVDAQPYRYEPPMTCVYYSYWSGVRDRTASFHARPGQLVLVWPTNDDLTCVYVAWPAAEFSRVRRDLDAAFHAALAQVPQVAEKVAAARQVQPFTGTRALPNQYRRSAGPGWALVGDAGHHKDPCTGMGIGDAFLSAELLAARIAGPGPDATIDDRRLDDYERARDAATAATFDLTRRTARLAPLSPQLASFYRAAADRADVTERIFGVLGGTVAADEVFSRERIESVLAETGSVAPSRDR